jgi:hypothetical protein
VNTDFCPEWILTSPEQFVKELHRSRRRWTTSGASSLHWQFADDPDAGFRECRNAATACFDINDICTDALLAPVHSMRNTSVPSKARSLIPGNTVAETSRPDFNACLGARD